MEFSGVGGGVIVALAAGLWLVYLMPTWFRRRDYIASERAEVRRQQALRVLQETAALVAPPRTEPAAPIVSPSGEVTDHERLALAIERSRQAQANRVASRKLVEAAKPPVQEAVARARMSRRLRRTRAVATLLLLASLVLIVVQLVVIAMTGVAVAAVAVIGFSAVVGVVSFAALGRLASIARRRSVGPARAATALRKTSSVGPIVRSEDAAAEARATEWTPVPIPKPLYLSRSEAPAEHPPQRSLDHAAILRAAAREADRALRDAQTAPGVTPITGRSVTRPASSARETPVAQGTASASAATPAAAPSRYASMGVLDGLGAVGTDLDEVLRRRRATA
ncbi:hypothetical protein [Galbitalea soli]|uniref:Large exoprotein n=1 Tax=Galbitalea soli TaxID=1268042 RepID=A0A7C9TQS0_9MICO|nr:hypothetical protein [Galbitalea soli]NEM91375.1 hypothetical protein [Galbitalea soli]NYJ30066.1 hypothetical protein [Galbitalea soli]